MSPAAPAPKARINFVDGDHIDVIETVTAICAQSWPPAMLGAAVLAPPNNMLVHLTSGDEVWVNLRQATRVSPL
jgi:hypothetical protein